MGVRSGGVSQFQYPLNLGRGQQLPSPTGYPGPSVTYASQQTPASAFARYAASGQQLQMPPSLSEAMLASQAYSTQPSPISPHFNAGPNTQASPMQSIGTALQHSQQATPTMSGSYSGLPYDTNDSLQYNFDTASFNFGNHYGALEFGMLGHMSSGAAEIPSSESAGNMGQGNNGSFTTPSTMSTGYNNSPNATQPYIFPQDQGIPEWRSDLPSNVRRSNPSSLYAYGQTHDPSETMKQEEPHAFAIGASSAFASPDTSSSSQGFMTTLEESSAATAAYANNTLRRGRSDYFPQKQEPQSTISTPSLRASALPTKRARDSSKVYENVTQPYSYTTGFHKMTALLQKRFSPSKTLQIAQALARIRPSFISSTRNLSHEDLVFMEKCFQRTLWEYEDFISGVGTPTIVCRRTGEVAAVGKEFSILTGWSKDVLLGKAPNLNVNTGGTSGPPGTGASSRGGSNTPRIPDDSRTQPVFLAELLDDESAIEFYEDFARLAFGDSRGSVTTTCKLLKYKTVNETSYAGKAEEDFDEAFDARLKRKRRTNGGNNGMKPGGLGDKDGKVECTYCWMVKRDVFDIPMLIVMNVSIRASFLFCVADHDSSYHVYE